MAELPLQLVQRTWPQLVDGSYNYTPFADTPARDVLQHLPEGVSAAAVLLLGCADPSSLLTTLAASHPGLQRLMAVLHAANPMQLARAAFLLLLAAELDPDSQDDMQVLWEVWYCAAWSHTTLPRVTPFIERLLKDSVPWMTAVRPTDKDAIHRVWSSWLAKGKPSFRSAMKARQEVKELLASKSGHATLGKALLEGASQQFVKLGSHQDLQDTLQHQPNPQQLGVSDTDLVQKVLQQDLTSFFNTGYLAPNYSGQQAARARFVNVTLLHPSTNQWCFNLCCSPALCWGPFGATELVSAVKTGAHIVSGIVARACIAHITQLVRSFQANTQLVRQSAAEGRHEQESSISGSRGGVRLQVQLVCMDALQLCLGMPLSDAQAASQPGPPHAQQQTAEGAPAAAGHVGNAPAPLLFDAIDSSLLADEVGLLPLLVAAGPRLCPAHHSRLLVGLRKWAINKGTLADYTFNMALCIPASLTPTLLGLRLLTDLEADRPETAGQEYTYRVDGFRELVWAPIPKELRTIPLPRIGMFGLLGGLMEGGIDDCLQVVAKQLCCANRATHAPGKRGLESGTPQLLACLLTALAERTDMRDVILEGRKFTDDELVDIYNSTNDKELFVSAMQHASPADARDRYADMQRVLWALSTKTAQLLPHQFQQAFITGIDMLRSSLQQHAPADWQPADVPPCPGVKRLMVPLDPNLQCKHGTVRPVLVDCSNEQHQQGKPAKIDAWAFKGTAVPTGVHIVDTWASDLCAQSQGLLPARAEAAVYLPADFALGSTQANICLAGTKHQVPVQQGLSQSTVQAPAILAQLLLPSTCAGAASYHPSSTATQPASTGSSRPSTHLRLEVLCLQETEQTYSVNLGVVDGDGRVVKQMLSARPPPGLYHGIGSLQQFQELRYALQHNVELPAGNCSCTYCWQHSSAHQLVFVLNGLEDQVQPVEVQTVWPMALGFHEPDDIVPGSYSNGQNYKYAYLNGTIVMHIFKAQVWEMWPDDASWGMAPKPLHLSSLTAVTPTAADAIHRCNQAQYSSKEEFEAGQVMPNISNVNLGFMLHSLLTQLTNLGCDPKDAIEMPDEATSGRSSHRTRMSHFDKPEDGCRCRSKKEQGAELRTLVGLLMHTMGVDRPLPCCSITRLTAYEPYVDSDGHADSTAVHMLLHPPVLMTKAGRPVLPVTVLDASMCTAACLGKDVAQRYRSQMRKLGFEPGHLAPWSIMMMDGCRALRRMLLCHALACQPTAAQQASPPDGQRIPCYYNSYLSFTQCLASQYPMHAKLSLPAKKAAAGSTRTSAASMYLKYRVEEVLTELGRCKTQEDKKEWLAELQQLLSQEGGQLPP